MCLVVVVVVRREEFEGKKERGRGAKGEVGGSKWERKGGK
jgi:hypothetical protein